MYRRKIIWILSSLLFLSVTYFLLPTASFAQITFERTYGDMSDDGGYSVQQTSDGGYIISGVADCNLFVRVGDVYLIKTDSLGDTLWTKKYGGDSLDGGFSVQQTSDGGYIIAGWTYKDISSLYDVYLIKTDSMGDTLWSREYYYSGSEDGSYSVQQTSDGGYIVAGWTYLDSPFLYNVYLIKTDTTGSVIWMRTYGDTANDCGYSVKETFDGGFIITGCTNCYTNSSDVYLIKTDSLGDTLWTRTYGGTGSDYGMSVQQTSDGGYILSGYTYSFGAGFYDVYLIKTDSLGDTLWTRTYGSTGRDYGMSVQQTAPDGGYIISGYTGSFGAGFYDVYLVKTDSLGDTLWTRTFGGSLDDYGRSVQQTSDGGYIIAGYTISFAGTVYLIKTDSLGQVVGIEESPESIVQSPKSILFQNYPNPLNKLTAISYQLRAPGHTTLKIYDLTGRLVETLVDEHSKPGVYQVEWDSRSGVLHVSSGIYFYRLQAGEFTDTKKLILLH